MPSPLKSPTTIETGFLPTPHPPSTPNHPFPKFDRSSMKPPMLFGGGGKLAVTAKFGRPYEFAAKPKSPAAMAQGSPPTLPVMPSSGPPVNVPSPLPSNNNIVSSYE